LPQQSADRLLEVKRDMVEQLLPLVLADAAVAGLNLVVKLSIEQWNAAAPVLQVTADGFTPSSYDEPPGDEAGLLAWLADSVQQPTMERGATPKAAT